MQARNDDDLHGGQGQQRSNTVNNICITSMRPKKKSLIALSPLKKKMGR